MTNEESKDQLKKYLLQNNSHLSDEDTEQVASSLLELASFAMKLFLSHKNQEKSE